MEEQTIGTFRDQVQFLFIGSFEEIPLLEASPISENLFLQFRHAFSSHLHKMRAFSCENARIFNERPYPVG